METNHRLPSFNIIVLLVLGLFGFIVVTSEGRQCDSHSDCLGDYRRCCRGYCRRSCNLSCTRDEHCGSPGSIEEYCCKGKCISASTLCQKPVPQEEVVLSTAVIAVIAIFGVILIVALCFVLRSYWCKLLRICLSARGPSQADTGSKVRGGNGFVELGRESVVNGTDESFSHPQRISAQSNITWVGQDMRIVPPKDRVHGMSKAQQSNVKMILS